MGPVSATRPIVNARMYSVTPACKADWKTVLGWALDRAGLDWPLVDHDSPAPLAELWARDDLGAAMMCGLPYSLRQPRPTLVAAPVPSPPRYEGRSIYFTDVVVAAASRFETIEDTFGGIVGYTLADSLSGGVAWREFLRPWRTAERPRLYRAAIGGLIHARGVIDALAAGRIDVGPLDSYSHDLLRGYDPAFAAQVRVVATTPARPMPPLIATAAIADADLARLRAALRATAEAAELRQAMARLLLAGFGVPAPSAYDPLAALGRASSPTFEEL
jgi:ABC-type phosphate/phosphonate transport system substrate-binding protein